MACNKDAGIIQSGVQYGTISGKILHPDNNMLILVTSEERVDTATRNPESQMFTIDSIKYGKCILQIWADGYGLFEQMLTIDKPLYICHDIMLAQFPSVINFIYPSSSQYLDFPYFSISSPSITDSGFWCFINFLDKMDTPSVNSALTLSPDAVGVQKEWTPLTTTLSLFYPYWRLSTIDTVKIKIGRTALDQWGDTLNRELLLFYPVDTNFIRTTMVKKK
jgi:hypothetical protein